MASGTSDERLGLWRRPMRPCLPLHMPRASTTHGEAGAFSRSPPTFYLWWWISHERRPQLRGCPHGQHPGSGSLLVATPWPIAMAAVRSPSQLMWCLVVAATGYPSRQQRGAAPRPTRTALPVGAAHVVVAATARRSRLYGDLDDRAAKALHGAVEEGQLHGQERLRCS